LPNQEKGRRNVSNINDHFSFRSALDITYHSLYNKQDYT